ncbi:uncharacterized protein isoform X2 [Leptinotarsa decemlineata]|uniref:uncharacterized protein isoform X2 n=1 Tax=Leptinotarsa decemlineata TaxID=7539 RepID=UPI000C253455|nr:uncharacterized protein LOC111502317 isoform X2 [Leptinotarsa decemlineata]
MPALEAKRGSKEDEAWADMLDSLVDFISASKTMIKIINKKIQASRDESETVDSISPETPRSIIISDSIEEIHRNPSFNVYIPQSSMMAEVFQEDLTSQPNNVFPKYHSSSQFLTEQYHLTKQAIARKYRPQNRLTPNTLKKSPIEDYFMNEMFTEGLYRISNNTSESIKPPSCQEKYKEVPRIYRKASYDS